MNPFPALRSSGSSGDVTRRSAFQLETTRSALNFVNSSRSHLDTDPHDCPITNFTLPKDLEPKFRAHLYSNKIFHATAILSASFLVLLLFQIVTFSRFPTPMVHLLIIIEIFLLFFLLYYYSRPCLPLASTFHFSFILLLLFILITLVIVPEDSIPLLFIPSVVLFVTDFYSPFSRAFYHFLFSVLSFYYIFTYNPQYFSSFSLIIFASFFLSLFLHAHDLQAKKLWFDARELDKVRSRAEELIYNILPTSLMNRLASKNNDKTLVVDASEAIILFCEVIGIPEVDKIDKPVELLVTINRIIGIIDELCNKFELTKLKTVGTTFMASVGVVQSERPETNSATTYDDNFLLNNLTSAVNFACSLVEVVSLIDFPILSTINNYSGSLGIKIGISQGPVSAGIIGAKKFLFDCFGDCVNVASRLMTSAKTNQILIDQNLYSSIKIYSNFEPFYSCTFDTSLKLNLKGKGFVPVIVLRPPITPYDSVKKYISFVFYPFLRSSPSLLSSRPCLFRNSSQLLSTCSFVSNELVIRTSCSEFNCNNVNSNFVTNSELFKDFTVEIPTSRPRKFSLSVTIPTDNPSLSLPSASQNRASFLSVATPSSRFLEGRSLEQFNNSIGLCGFLNDGSPITRLEEASEESASDEDEFILEIPEYTPLGQTSGVKGLLVVKFYSKFLNAVFNIIDKFNNVLLGTYVESPVPENPLSFPFNFNQKLNQNFDEKEFTFMFTHGRLLMVLIFFFYILVAITLYSSCYYGRFALYLISCSLLVLPWIYVALKIIRNQNFESKFLLHNLCQFLFIYLNWFSVFITIHYNNFSNFMENCPCRPFLGTFYMVNIIISALYFCVFSFSKIILYHIIPAQILTPIFVLILDVPSRWVKFAIKSELVFVTVLLISTFLSYVCVFVTSRNRHPTVKIYRTLHREQSKLKLLLDNILPSHLSQNFLSPTDDILSFRPSYQETVVMFIDIVGFTQFCSSKTASVVTTILNDLYKEFDKCLELRTDVQKIRTVGDAFICCAGLDNSDLLSFIFEVAAFCLDVISVAKNFSNELIDEPFKVRIGASYGPVLAGLVGSVRISYDLFGPTVQHAHLLEQNCRPNHVLFDMSLISQLQRLSTVAFVFGDFVDVPPNGGRYLLSYTRRRSSASRRFSSPSPSPSWR
ncbi:hypothetical protein RCL1_004827 [Eukaryota sp. TZLM3-RCL]